MRQLVKEDTYFPKPRNSTLSIRAIYSLRPIKIMTVSIQTYVASGTTKTVADDKCCTLSVKEIHRGVGVTQPNSCAFRSELGFL